MDQHLVDVVAVMDTEPLERAVSLIDEQVAHQIVNRELSDEGTIRTHTERLQKLVAAREKLIEHIAAAEEGNL